jgi:RNA polymerase sigma factor (sigma-70 family)
MDSQELRLLKEMQDGAWRAWDVKTRPGLWRFFVYHGVRREEADDLTQETLRRVASRIRAFPLEDHEKVEGWVYTIAGRVCAEWVRKRIKRPPPLPLDEVRETAALPHEPVTDEVFDVRDLAPPLRRALAKLSPRQHTFFILRHIHGMEPCEIAARHGCTAGTVYQTLTTAKRRLRDKLEGLLGEAVS